MQSLRHQRVRELLKREVGEIIRREIATGDAGLITVNDVGLAGDLQSATVFVGIVGTSEQQRKGLAILKKERHRIQGLLGRAVVLKYTPKLRFERDDSIERGNRVLQILEELERTLPPS
jgi:ribosome-binding factor A